MCLSLRLILEHNHFHNTSRWHWGHNNQSVSCVSSLFLNKLTLFFFFSIQIMYFEKFKVFRKNLQKKYSDHFCYIFFFKSVLWVAIEVFSWILDLTRCHYTVRLAYPLSLANSAIGGRDQMVTARYLSQYLSKNLSTRMRREFKKFFS